MKNIKIIVLTALISVVLTSGIAVAAATLAAKDIGFTASNEEWKVDNVEDAVNDLYESSKNAEPEKTYIVKDGVVQEGYELILDNATQNYDSENGFLEIIKTNTSYIGYAAFQVDLTDYKFVYGNITSYQASDITELYKIITVKDSITKNSGSNYGGVTDFKHASGGIVEIDDLTGNKYIQIAGYGSSHREGYSFKIKDLWLEK